MIEDEISAIARHMIAKYGAERAIEIASGYAAGFYFHLTKEGQKYWRQIEEKIKELRKTDG